MCSAKYDSSSGAPNPRNRAIVHSLRTPWNGRLIACLCLFVLAACQSGPAAWRPLWRAPYGYLPMPSRLEFDRARQQMKVGEWQGAQVRLETLISEHPDELDLGFALQDVQSKMLALGELPQMQEGWIEPSIAGQPGPGQATSQQLDSASVLKFWYARRAAQSPSIPSLVLAARVETDPTQALTWLNRALALDPTCAWAHYGRAYALLRQRDQYRWRDSRAALAQALVLDPSHVLARRMEAWMLAQEGDTGQAAIALERWLIATEFDPRVGHKSRVEARLDLARVWLTAGRVDPALRELKSMEGEPYDRERRLLLFAVALTEKGDAEGALSVVRQAGLIPGVGVLPWVQEALLLEHWFEDGQGALVLWKQILEEAEDSSDPAVILQSFRARVVVERSESNSLRDQFERNTVGPPKSSATRP
ncbi:MAG: Flp pilus assembly protein TadD [Planctomycetota bacterium]|jgi:Flp pilus assembly protein TadD